MRRGGGRIGWLLVAAASIGGAALAPAAGAGGTQPTAVSATAPPGPEVAGLRTRTSRTYVAPNGDRVARIFAGSVNYQAADGSWQPIDDTLEAVPGGYRNAANRFAADLPSDLSQGPVRISEGGDSVAFSLTGASPVAGQPAGDAIAYPAAEPGVDVSYDVQPDALKETLTLASASAAHDFSFPLQLSDGLTPRLRSANTIEIEDAAGHVRFTLPAPFMTDAGGVTSRAVDYTLSSTASGWVVGLHAAGAWLDAPGRQFPVRIDPVVFPSGGSICELIQSTPSTSACANPTLQVGYAGGGDHRAAMMFNAPGSVPANADVIHASIGMWLASEASTTAPKVVDLYPATTAWNSSTTWNSATGTTAWTTPGGDFDTTITPESKPTIGGSAGDTGHYWYWDVTGMARRWIDGSLTDDGVIVKTDGGTDNSFTFNTNHNTGGDSPFMEITYSPYLGDQPGFQMDRQRLSDRIDLAVNAATGNLLVSQTDLRMPGGFGPPLAISRSYNSLSDRTTELGSNWSMDVGADLKMYPEAWEDNNATRKNAYFYGPGGEKLFFGDAGTTGTTRAFTSPLAMDASLTQDASVSNGVYDLTDHASQTTYEFYGWGPIHYIRDRNGKTVCFNYDANGRGTDVIDGRGEVTTFSYDANGNLSTITDPAGHTEQFFYTSGRLTKFTDANGHDTLYAYADPNNANLLTKITTPGGRVTVIGYDTSGRVSSVKRVTDPVAGTGPTTTYAYDEQYDATGTGTVTNPLSVATRYFFDTRKRVTKATLDYGGSLARDVNGHYDATTGKADQYFAPFNAVSGGTPNMALTFGANGLPATSSVLTGSSTPNVKTSTFYGDTDRTMPDGATTAFPTGTPGGDWLRTRAVDEQGKETWFGYDSYGNLKTASGMRDSAGTWSAVSTVTIDRDLANSAPWKVLDTKDGNGNETDYAYDSVGDLTSISPPNATLCATNGLMCATTIDYGLSTSDTYKLGRVVSVQTGATGPKAAYTYDNLGRVTQVDYSNGTTTSSSVAFTYDNDGNLTQRVDTCTTCLGVDSGTTTYGYDALNRVTGESFPGGASDSETYDGASNLTSVTDGNGTTYYDYDALDRLHVLTEPGKTHDGDPSHGVIYTWPGSSDDSLAVSYPTSPIVHDDLAFDKAGRLLSTCAWQYSSTSSCGPTSPLLKLTYDYTDTSVSPSASRALLQSSTDTTGHTTTYAYDELGRLTDALTRNSSGVETTDFGYTYDGAGNMLTRTHYGDSDRNYAYNADNEMCSKIIGTSSGHDCASPPVGASSLTYNGAGNETSGNSRTDTYNDRDQLSSITVGGTAEAHHDRGPGQAELSTVGSTSLVYSPLGLADYGTDEYIRGPDGTAVSQIVGGTRSYFLQDNLGSTRGLLSTSGTLADSFAFDPYGRDIGTNSIGATTTRIGYAGGLLDPNSNGAYHFGQRYYDPGIQRWTQPDPLGGANLFTYVGEEPISAKDPSGLVEEDFGGGGGEGGGGGGYEFTRPDYGASGSGTSYGGGTEIGDARQAFDRAASQYYRALGVGEPRIAGMTRGQRVVWVVVQGVRAITRLLGGG